MRLRLLVTAGVIASVALVSGQGSQTGSGQPGPAQPADAARQRQLIDQYYVTSQTVVERGSMVTSSRSATC